MNKPPRGPGAGVGGACREERDDFEAELVVAVAVAVAFAESEST